MFPKFFIKYIRLGIWNKLRCETRDHDPFYFLQHRYFLSKGFTVRQRVESAITHHSYESERFSKGYEHQIYRADGIRLWEHASDDHDFWITLTSSESNRNEGDLSVVLICDGTPLWRVSFSYLRGTTFNLEPQVVLLVGRNQAESRDKKSFYQTFGQNQPQLFCIAAVCGVVMANGWDSFVAIRHDQQIAYDKTLDSGFYNSYTALWKQFDAREIDEHVFEMGAPLNIRPLSAVSPSHRTRARGRREYWDAIAQSAQATLSGYFKPIDGNP